MILNKYRVVYANSFFYPQRRWRLFWWEHITIGGVGVRSLTRARDIIDSYKAPADLVVIYEE